MKFEHCIRCTICVENCPVFRVNPEFPGPKQAGPDSQRFRNEREKAVDDWVFLCSQCKRCEMACPCGVEPAQIILKQQQRCGLEHARKPARLLFANNYYLSMLGSFTAPVTNRIVKTKAGKKVLNAMGIATNVPFPKFSVRKLSQEKKMRGRQKRKVAFFYGCFLNFYRPDIGKKIIHWLRSMKVDVVLPPQWCCGLPALGNGNLSLARSFAQKNVESLSRYVDAGYDIIYSCTSCGLCLLEDYQGVMNIPQARKIAEHTYNLYEYVLKLMADGYVQPEFGEVKHDVAYHIPCHLRALKIGYPAAKLMAMIPGLTCHVLDDACCGLSGSYGFKQSNEASATRLGLKATGLIEKTKAQMVMADCGSCRMQLEKFSGRDVFDPVEIIYKSLSVQQLNT